MARNGSPLDGPRVAPDPLSTDSGIAGTWSEPMQPLHDHGAQLPRETFDYSKGLLVGPDVDADALPQVAHPGLIRVRTDLPPSYEQPHEATHRRFEPPRIFPIAQAAAGFTVVAPTLMGLHFVKLIALVVTLDAAGTIKFVQGSNDGTLTGDLSGAMAVATNGQLVLPPADLSTPWVFTASDQAFGIFTVTGKAQGFAVCVYSPYES